MPRSPLWTRIAAAALRLAFLTYAREGILILYESATLWSRLRQCGVR